MSDFADGTGVKHYLTASEPNGDGHFGELNHLSHRDYETLIAPTLSVNRVLSDVTHTLNRGGDVQMPPGILLGGDLGRIERRPAVRPARRLDVEVPRPDDVDIAEGVEEEEDAQRPPTSNPAHQPTANMLGWRQATALNKNQLAEMTQIFEDPGTLLSVPHTSKDGLRKKLP
ncbi:hypothetical protein PYW08_006132 [Mythimna loreyi]|uniref:Uncharacterized protein n=1 Tax=Mythimna loreyi TaxID=667449 RepID=A0ACC2QPC2_9NEOP|nr:hypothetical protein PYW08_006132 [Mythimna loreyi]